MPSPGDLPDPGIKLRAPTLQADSLPAEPPEKPHWLQGTMTFLSLCSLELGPGLSAQQLLIPQMCGKNEAVGDLFH